MRARSASLGTTGASRYHSPLMGRSPTSPHGGAGSDAESTDLDSSGLYTPTRAVPGNLRPRCKSGDTPPPSKSWKSLGSVRKLFSPRAEDPVPAAAEVFFLWDALPEQVRFASCAFLSVPDIQSLALVSREVYMFARSDIMWRPLFFSRFGGTEGIPVTFATEDFFNEYCERLIDPQPGDQVEVAWEGTFNLLDDDVVSTYAGRAWWSATIVECMEQHYKIHYPQWDASVWDEWVPRHRVRWPAREVDTKCVIRKGDVVEHKCQSSHGISPWLEALVTDAVGADGFRLGDVVLSDPRRVVQRSTLKLVHRPRGRLFNRFRASSHSRCVVM